jgi:hypothetical protein
MGRRPLLALMAIIFSQVLVIGYLEFHVAAYVVGGLTLTTFFLGKTKATVEMQNRRSLR